MANRFKQAAPKAKKLYKTGRYKTFAAAMAAALKTTGKKKRSRPAAKKRRRKVSGRKTIARAPRRVGFAELPMVGPIAIGSLKAQIRKKIKNDLDKAVLRKYHATKKRAKKQAQKTITAFKAALRKYS